MLQEVLAGKPAGTAIVYVTLQKTADRITQMLKNHGLDAAAYHAGMKNEDREAVQNEFMAGKPGLSWQQSHLEWGLIKTTFEK